MLADLPILWILEDTLLSDSIMYTVHHVISVMSCSLTLNYGRSEWFMIYLITCEITNLFFNGQFLLEGSPYQFPCQLLFLIGFLGYRMAFLIRGAIHYMVHLFKQGKYFDLFVINIGIVVGTQLHFYWTYLILQKIALLFL
jgi:hypothetical protein